MAYTKNALASGATITKSALDNMENGIAAALAPTGTAGAGKYVDGGSLAWTALPTAGGTNFGTINPKDAAYGAKGDGSTDDTAALQAAFNAAGAANASVLIPAGVYIISATITLPNVRNLVYSGVGQQTRLQLKNGANCYILTFPGTDSAGSLTIRDMTLDGNLANQTATSGGINAVGATSCLFTNLRITNCRDDCLLLSAQTNNAFGHNNRVTNCLMDQSMSSTAGGFGIRMTSNDENQIIGCDFQYLGGSGTTGGDHGAFILDRAGLQFITACNFVNGNTNATPGIRVQDVQSTRITGCNFDGTGGDSIFIAGSKCTVVGNTIYGPGQSATSAYSGVHLEYNANHNLVVGNTIVSSGVNNQTRSFVREDNQGSSGSNLITHNQFVTTGTITGPALDVNSPGTIAHNNLGVSNIGAGTGAILSLQNAVNIPSVGPAIYVAAGALKFLGGSGTVTTLAPA